MSSIYTILERIEIIEKELEEIKTYATNIEEIADNARVSLINLEEINKDLNDRMDMIEENIDMVKIKKVLELEKHLNRMKKVLGID